MDSKAVCASAAVILLLACSSQRTPTESLSIAPRADAPSGAGVPAIHADANGGRTATTTTRAPAGTQAPVAGALSPIVPMVTNSANSAGAAPAAGSVAGSGATGAPTSHSADATPVGPSGLVVDSATGDLVFRTAPLDLPPGKESYTCFAATLDQDVVVDGFTKSAQAYVHHAQFVKAFVPEPEGISVCNEQFKLTWLPIFLAGNGPSELRFDEGIGHVVSAGTQLVLQMHLLNTSDTAAKQAVEIRMHLSSSPNPTPVTPWAIGSSKIHLAARQAGVAQNVCTQTAPVELLAVFPHMHQHGTRFHIEVGKSLDAMRPLYARDPFDFDDQHMEKRKISLDAGDVLRVTCDYMNATDQEITFGESSNDEMCFFVAFALGEAPAQADCPNLWDALLTL